jgi:uncharacterized protein YigA (DUF484 family)
VQQDLRQWVNDICALESQLNFWQELSRRFNRELDGIGMSTCEPVDINIRNMGQRIREQAAEIEKLRMQLAACGVAAMANTSATAPLARNVSPEYNSASLQDVCRAVDREMAQRAQVAFLEVKVQTMEAEIQRNRAIIRDAGRPHAVERSRDPREESRAVGETGGN